MHSTAASNDRRRRGTVSAHARTGARALFGSFAGAPLPSERSAIAGIRGLIRFIHEGSLPGGFRNEWEPVMALLALEGGTLRSSRDFGELKDVLTKAVRDLHDRGVVRRLRGRLATLVMGGRASRRELRFRVLLVLTALVLSHGEDRHSDTLVALNSLGIFDLSRNGLQELLRGIRTWTFSRQQRSLMNAYLGLASRYLVNPADEPADRRDREDLEAFMAKGSVHQLVMLLAWRHSWSSENIVNPACCAHRIEFALARCGAFGRLARRGGPLAQGVLERLGYQDVPAGGRAAIAAYLALAGILVAASFAFVGSLRERDRAAVRTVVVRAAELRRDALPMIGRAAAFAGLDESVSSQARRTSEEASSRSESAAIPKP